MMDFEFHLPFGLVDTAVKTPLDWYWYRKWPLSLTIDTVIAHHSPALGLLVIKNPTGTRQIPAVKVESLYLWKMHWYNGCKGLFFVGMEISCCSQNSGPEHITSFTRLMNMQFLDDMHYDYVHKWSLPAYHQDILIFRPVHGRGSNCYNSDFWACSLERLTIAYN